MRTLPIFPLSLVLFPGVTIPLHIFEPRYRRMLADCLENDRRFGLIFLPEHTGERDLPPGHVGCVAQVEAHEPMPDGRSNITVSGQERFALEHWIESDAPYHVAEVSVHQDLDEPRDHLDSLAIELRTLFIRVARAAHIITDDRAGVPDLPDDPSQLSFRIASLIDIDLSMRQGMLTSRSPSLRIRELQRVLGGAVSSLERRAGVHLHAKTNGGGSGPALPSS